MQADEFAPFFRQEFPKLVLHLRTRGFGKLAEDVAEETMAEAFRKWQDITAPSAWVRTVAVRKAMRADSHEQGLTLAESAYARQMDGLTPPPPDTRALEREEQANVLRCLERMPQMRRHVVALAFDGFEIKEIARELAIAEGTVRSHLRHARRSLDCAAQGPGGEA